MSHKATEAKLRTIGCELTEYSVALPPSRLPAKSLPSLSACSYGRVNTWIFGILANFTQFFLLEIFVLRV